MLWGFPQMGVPQNGWFIVVESPIQMDDLGYHQFHEVSKCEYESTFRDLS